MSSNNGNQTSNLASVIQDVVRQDVKARNEERKKMIEELKKEWEEQRTKEQEVFNKKIQEMEAKMVVEDAALSELFNIEFDKETPKKETPKKENPKGKTSNKENPGRGRTPLISDELFLRIVNREDSADAVIARIPELREMSPEKAKQYVVSRKAYLKKQGNEVKDFPRGRPSHQS